jgi:hypothetical protein
MPTVLQRHSIPCPYMRARHLLAEILAAWEREGAELDLEWPVSDHRAFAERVRIAVAKGTDPYHMDEVWAIAWEPEGGPFPSFEGTLSVRGDEGYERAVLELEGRYEPPLGAVGRAFDLVAGNKIAAATARRLLERLGAAIEHRYAEEERAKR